MSKVTIQTGMLVRVLILALLAFLLLLVPPILTIFLFVPIMAWFLWSDRDRIAELERRLAALEKPGTPKSEEA